MGKYETTANHPWYELSLAFAKARNSFTEIKFCSAEYFAWRYYFSKLEWFPVAFWKMNEVHSWTAPCLQPDELEIQLPADYPRRHPDDIRRLAEAPKQYDGRQMRQNIEQLKSRFGSTWGLGKRMPLNEAMRRQVVREKQGLTEEQRTAAQDAHLRASNDRRILAEYSRLKQEPVYATDGMLVSPELAALLADEAAE